MSSCTQRQLFVKHNARNRTMCLKYPQTQARILPVKCCLLLRLPSYPGSLFTYLLCCSGTFTRCRQKKLATPLISPKHSFNFLLRWYITCCGCLVSISVSHPVKSVPCCSEKPRHWHNWISLSVAAWRRHILSHRRKHVGRRGGRCFARPP